MPWPTCARTWGRRMAEDAQEYSRPRGRTSRLLERLGESQRAHRLVTSTPAAREVAMRFIGAEELDEVLDMVAVRLDQGLLATLEPILPEATDREAATQAVETYLATLDGIGRRGFAEPVDVAVRLAAIGLSVGRGGQQLATANLATICRAARNAGAQVTLDMADHTTVDATFAAFTELHQDFPTLGVAVQSQLRRTLVDCRWLATMPVRVRLCKGAYSEPSTVAHAHSSEIDAAFVRCLAVLMAGKGYPMVATLDPRLVKMTEELAARNNRTARDYEVQMYHGVRSWEHRRLVDTGHRVRVHLPFGENWYSHLVQRVAERPANVAPLLRALVTRR